MNERHMQIILEEMDSKFALMVECFATLDRKIDRVGGELREEIGLCNFKIDTLAKRIDSVEDRLSKRIDSVEENLNKRIDSVEDRLSKRIDSVEENLNKRIDSVEDRLSKRIDSVEENLTRHIDAVAADLAAHRADTEGHRGAWQVRE